MPEQLSIFIEHLFNALSLAGIYLLIAMGLTLVFGLTRIVNFAQGEFVTLGAFATLTLVQFGFPIPLALVFAGVGVGLLSEVLDLGVFRRTLSRPINGFIVSLGLIVALEAAYAIIWPEPVYFIKPFLPGAWKIAGVTLVKERVFLVAVAAALAGMLFIFLERTHYGRGIRALSEDRTSAQVLGVRVGRLISVTFIIGSGLSAIAGGLLGTLFPFTAFFGPAFLLKGFAVAIVGGLGNVRGVIVAALLLAVAETMGAAYISIAWSYAILLVVMVVIILWRPYGLFQSAEQAGGDPLHADHLIGAAQGFSPAVLATRLGRVLNSMPRVAIVVLGVLLLTAPFWLDSYKSIALATFALVSAIAVYSMWFGFRFAGIFSVAQAGFLGIGAYGTVILTLRYQINFWEQVLVSVALGGALAAAFAWVALRASGTYLLMLLFALSELEIIVIRNWSSVTGGDTGIVLAAAPDPFFGAISFKDPVSLYYLVLAFTALAVLFLWWLSRTRFGKQLASLRDNEVLAQSLGLNTFRYKLLALTVTGAVAGLGGALFVFVDVGISPPYFTVNAGIQYSLMMLLGGSGTLAGPMIGAFVATFLPGLLHIDPYQAQLVYGVLLVLIIVLLPTGVIGAVRQYYFRLANAALARWA
ncbi:MAG: branched-chain amino acid transport system permease protein livM [Chloroflexota bacterium]|jgi:ABC-type branched-subunit amino acid transport system permease subunit|nr:branched-chain amino acid transport system permease protein livM [Chloroflexota bacterium]